MLLRTIPPCLRLACKLISLYPAILLHQGAATDASGSVDQCKIIYRIVNQAYEMALLSQGLRHAKGISSACGDISK
jgi:hypothetical protein